MISQISITEFLHRADTLFGDARSGSRLKKRKLLDRFIASLIDRKRGAVLANDHVITATACGGFQDKNLIVDLAADAETSNVGVPNRLAGLQSVDEFFVMRCLAFFIPRPVFRG